MTLLGLAATGAAALTFAPMDPPVNLQATSPGTAQTGHFNISGTATVGLLKSQGTVFGQSTAPTGFAYGGYFTAASNQGRGFYGFASSPTGLTYGGFFQNASESGRAVYGLATATTGFNYGGYFQSASSTGRGLLGVAASASGVNYGVYGVTQSPSGYGVFSDGNLGIDGKLVSGESTWMAVNPRAEVYQNNSLTTGTIYAQNGVPNERVQARVAIQGNSAGTTPCYGVAGYGLSTDGVSIGVSGYAKGSKVNFAVYGFSSGGTTNYAGYFLGNIFANSASAGVKAFLIDHPLDPENKVLSHSSVESNERKNVYDGVVKTDAQGFATVTMPSWFHALNTDFRYQLTVLGDESADLCRRRLLANWRMESSVYEPRHLSSR